MIFFSERMKMKNVQWWTPAVIGLAGIWMAMVLTTGPAVLAADKTIRIKLATLAPEGSIWIDEISALNEALEKEADGRVQFKVYPGGIMGDDDVVLRKIRVGQLDGALFTTGALAKIDPQLHTLAFPGLFQSTDDVDRLLENSDSVLRPVLREKGYEMVGLMGLGFTYMFTQQPVTSVEDLKSAKGWLWDNDTIMKTMYDHAGITPVSIGISDVMTALQTGLLNTVFNTPTGILSMQWFNRVNTMVDLPLTHAFGAVVISRRNWAEIPDDLKPVVERLVRKHAAEITRKTREEDKKARQLLQDRGITIISPSDELRRTFDNVFTESTKTLTSEHIQPDLYRAIQNIIRNSPSASGS